MVATLQVQLGQRVHQSSLGYSRFLISQSLSDSRLGLFPGLFGANLVDIRSADSHISQDSHPLTGDFYKTFSHGEEVILAALADDDLTMGDLSHQRDVHREDTHLAFEPRQGNHIDLLGINPGLGRGDFQFESGHVVGILSVGQTTGQS